MMRLKRSRRSIAAVAALAALVGLLSPSAAHAEEAEEPISESVSATPIQLPGTSSTNSIIVCRANAQDPHDSTHFPGTMNSIGTIECTAPVDSLAITVSMEYSILTVAGPRTKSNSGRSSIMHNAARDCIPGYYRTRVTGWVVFPPGYTPSAGPVSHTSKYVVITCAD